MTPTPVKVHVDVRNPDRFTSPAWRWGRATELARLGLRPNPLDDAAVCSAWAFLWAMARAQTQKQIKAARNAYPLVAAAYRVYRAAGSTREQIEALLRAGEDIVRIAQATGLDVKVVHTYEALFCHVTHVVEWSLFDQECLRDQFDGPRAFESLA